MARHIWANAMVFTENQSDENNPGVTFVLTFNKS